MDTNRPDTPQQTDESLDWESRLEKLRQTRQLNAPYTHAPLVRESQEPAFEQKPKAKSVKFDDANRDVVLTEYLRKWQEEHNAMLEENAAETAETKVGAPRATFLTGLYLGAFGASHPLG